MSIEKKPPTQQLTPSEFKCEKQQRIFEFTAYSLEEPRFKN